MDDPVVAYYGMVKFLPIVLGKMCQLSLLEWMDDGQIAASQHGWMDGRMDGWVDGWLGGWMDGWMRPHLYETRILKSASCFCVFL